MKRINIKLFRLTVFVLMIFAFNQVFSQKVETAGPNFRNFYGIAWVGNAHENLVYAKQMGYEFVYYQKGMETDPLSNSLYFYVETPEYLTYGRTIDLTKKYSQQQIDFYEKNCALKNTSQPFPQNLATGWIFDTNSFTPLLDMQQQKVINRTIDSIIKLVKRVESRNPNFHFGGCGWDEPKANGDFHEFRNSKNVAASMQTWTGGDFDAVYQGNTHEYNNYTDGHMAFYKLLYKRLKEKYSTVYFFGEPFHVYDGWFNDIKNRPDAKEIPMDIVSQEGPGTDFVDDPRILATGLITKANIYCTTPNVFKDSDNRVIAAKAALNGAGFGWFGRFGGTGDMPAYKSITEVPARLKLIRVLANWENRNNTPGRSWDGHVYKSRNAIASKDVIAILQPGTKKLFVVFLTMNGKAVIPDEKKVISISKTDNLFIESGNGSNDFDVHQNIVRPKDASSLNKGYVIQLDK